MLVTYFLNYISQFVHEMNFHFYGMVKLVMNKLIERISVQMIFYTIIVPASQQKPGEEQKSYYFESQSSIVYNCPGN